MSFSVFVWLRLFFLSICTFVFVQIDYKKCRKVRSPVSVRNLVALYSYFIYVQHMYSISTYIGITYVLYMLICLYSILPTYFVINRLFSSESASYLSVRRIVYAYIITHRHSVLVLNLRKFEYACCELTRYLLISALFNVLEQHR